MPERLPALVAISHGTSSAEGQAAVRGLRDAVGEALGRRAARVDAGTDGARTPSLRLGHVDVEQPDVPATLASLDSGEPAVVVPLLLSAGYHVHVDLTEAVEAETGRPVVLAGALGPDDRLVAVLIRRLAEAGVRDDDAVVLAVAGSSDRRAVDDCLDMTARLAEASGRAVSVGFLSAAEPSLPAAVAAARADAAVARAIDAPGAPGALFGIPGVSDIPGLPGVRRTNRATDAAAPRVVVANYLLAPGYFDDLARDAGADVVAEPLLLPDAPAPAELVEIVLERYDEASARAR
ncbi:Sirohydrochlorin ferrochelatase [Agromyces sp. CF514]|uniref:sirohydrochlorin chelatase n=1 Tax=Agromyces sp. CF514 TaxID=1881031 RepID=UPI0008EF6FED|nr:CbiX/SirB N-terminal domain-containing protein [Agromyces sp. CF514]SFR66613.1 Sirohydrochlorin ferrochelatase [Agromyces sp. CF514]